MHVYKGMGELRDLTRFEGWMYRIAQNICRNQWERQQARKRDAELIPLENIERTLEEEHPVAGSNPLETALEKEKRQMLRRAIEELPPQMRRCVYLYIVEELTQSEIAAILKIPVNTVKAHLHQAQKVLREKLKPHFEEIRILGEER